jgi:hypothetical protein
MASGSTYTIPVERDLTAEERELIRWLLLHGSPGAHNYLAQVDVARVVGRCSCGCPSVDLSVDGIGPDRAAGMVSLSDWLWPTPEGPLFGLVLFATDGRLACLEAWSVDGIATPKRWPEPEELVTYEAHLAGPAAAPDHGGVTDS